MIDKGLYKDRKLTEKEKKTIKPVKQAGGMNYLGKQETVTVPKKWLSSPDHVVAELAYITPKEQKILLDANVYGSLKGKPNKGPGGIMSLQGDLGGYDASPGGPDSEKGNPGAGSDPKSRVADIMTGKMNIGQTVGYTGPDPTGRNKFGDFVYEPTAFDKAKAFYNKLPTPLNIVKNIAQKFGPLNNLDFYNEKVVPAGKTNLGFEDYMSARMAGTIDAYGNPINRTGNGGRQNILQTGIMGVQEVIPTETKDPLSKSASLKDLDFNYGTFSNPIMYSDL
tara:strand:- start:169 stop:1008 length:840 start_codon:yes stop_codon:yes gene_type:complete